MAAKPYPEQIASLSDAQQEIAYSMAAHIQQEMNAFREREAQIEAIRQSSGLNALEEAHAESRRELKELARRYRELVGENWNDALGYCRFAQAGESHKYEVKQVDQAAAKLHEMVGELGELITDAPVVLANVEGAKLTAKDIVEHVGDYSPEELGSMFLILATFHQSMVEEATFRLNAAAKALAILAGARSTTPTAEKVFIQ